MGLIGCKAGGNEITEERQLSLEDIEGQWTLVKIDTISSKQSLEVNKKYNNTAVEYQISSIEPVDGILQCTSLCPNKVPELTIEFAGDSLFEYTFPTDLRASGKISLSNNIIIGFNRWSSIWTNIESNIHVSMNSSPDTLRIEYLESTGLYLSEIYERSEFDPQLVSFLRAYHHNLPYEHGKYGLVHYDFQPVDYDSPFEHFHSFPHTIPETLDLSEDDMLKILKNEYNIDILTDGELKPYNLSSWGGGRLWLDPKDWYNGPDTSASILYDKIK
ncbi:MAG: hypothetical protein WDZ35_12610 [Crocinitomicaceae bacterium]